MSLKATQDDDQMGEKGALNSSGNKGLPPLKEEMQEPSTAVIQMTIQPQSTAYVEFPASLTEPLAVALAELPQALLDIIPTEEALVEPPASSCFEYVAEVGEPPMPRYEATGARAVLPPPPPAFSYRTDAALMHHFPAPAPAHSADAYDYTDEDEFALERALATMGQAGSGASAGSSGAPETPAPLAEPLGESLDAAALYHELERGFDLELYEGVQLPSNPPSIEYSDNGAMFQSELFELGQGGFMAQELSLAEQLGMEQEFPAALSPETAPAACFPLEGQPGPSRLPLEGQPGPSRLPLEGQPGPSRLPLEGQPGPSRLPLEGQPGPSRLPLEGQPGPSRLPLEGQPGSSRLRAHAVQIYPGEGEGEPQTCYITNLPRLAIEPTFLEDSSSQGEPLPLQTRPLPPASRPDDMLRQLLDAPGDDEGDVPSSPAASEDSSELDKENKPDTIAAALRSAALSFAADDSQTSENTSDTGVATVNVDSDASNAPEVTNSATSVAVGPCNVDLNQPKRGGKF